MSNVLKDCQQRIAELEESNRLLHRQLAQSQQACHQAEQELQRSREALQSCQVQLSASEPFLRLAIDRLPLAVFWKDRNSVYLGCNQYAASTANLDSPADSVGKTDYDFPWKPEEAEFFRECDRRIMESNTPELGIIEPQQRADGSQRWLETNKIPLHDAQGNVIGIVGTFADITDRVCIETQLKQQTIAMAGATDGIGISTQEGLVYLNQAHVQMFGYDSPEELLGKSWQVLYEADEIERFNREVIPPLMQHGSWQGEATAKRKDGSTFLQEMSLNITEDGSFICIFRDITQRKQTELALQQLNQALEQMVDERTQELRTSKARLHRLAANLPGLIFQFRLEPDGTRSFPYVSEGSRDIYELEPDNFLQVFDWVHEKDRDSLNEAIAASARTLGGFHHEHRIVTPSGVLKWVQAIARPERQEDGAINWDGIIIEISDRKQAEQEQQRLLAILEATPDIVGIADAQGNSLYLNRAGQRLLEIAAEEIDRFHISELTNPEAQKKIETEAIPIAVQTGMWQGESRLRSRSGHEFPVSQAIVAHKDDNGKLEFLSTIMRDISERARIEAERQRQEQALRSIVEGTASQTGEAFFRACVRSLALALDVRYVLIAEVANNKVAKTLAFWAGEDFGDNFEYDLAGTPCAVVLAENQLCRYSRAVRSRFPEDPALIQFDVESYVGIPILDPQGSLLGLLVVLHPEPMEQELKIQSSILEIFAARAGAEIERLRAEKVLREKDTLLQMALEAGKMGCWRWHRSTNETIWSDGVEAMLGLEAGSLGKTLGDYIDLIHPEDRDTVLRTIEQTLATEEEYNTQHRIFRSNGAICWIRGTGEIWRNDAGEAIGLFGSLLDDTQRKTAEIALIEFAEQISQQAQQEQLLNQIANQIRTSLDLDRILNTTVREIQLFLEVDRCYFAWYVQEEEEAYWDAIAEVHVPDLPGFVGKRHATRFGIHENLLLRQEILRLDDISAIQNTAARTALKGLGNKSMLVLPVRAESGQVGIIACIHSQAIRPWSDDEVDFLQAVVAQLAIALNQAELLAQSQARTQELEALLTQLQRTQTQLIQSEKMSSLGQMVAGVAHEINNPVNFIYGNIAHAKRYMEDFIRLLDLYQRHYPQPHPEIGEEAEAIGLEFLKEDLHKLFQSMQVGTNRIREIVKSLRTFSRLDEAEIKEVNLHDGIDSTLTILQTRLRAQSWRPEIQTIKDYMELPPIECYAGQLNQVFMNILSNAIDALEERDRDRTLDDMQKNPSTLRIQTRVIANQIAIRITDNGPGMSEATKARLFDPFFTTKPVGKGTGLGLSISYQIITERHQGQLSCTSHPRETTFTIEIPIQKNKA